MSFLFANPRSVEKRKFQVAYLTSEIALAQELQSYSGGLGVVAGSYMNGYEDLKYPAIAISMHTTHGYHQQRFNANGDMVAFYQPNPFPDAIHDTGKRFTLNAGGKECQVAIFQPRDRDRIYTGIIQLSTDIEENPDDIRQITRCLYGKRHASQFFSKDNKPWNEPHWLEIYQSFILGIGGYYALKKMGIKVDLYHLNDSHGAFLALHLYGLFREEGEGIEDALLKVRKMVRYTNHTLVTAGNATLNMNIVSKVGEAYVGINAKYINEIIGKDWEVPMSPICMELSGRQSGVAELHAQLLTKIYEKEVLANTNGVYLPMYQDKECANLDRPDQIPDLKRYLKEKAYGTLIERATTAGFNPVGMSHERFMKSLSIFIARRKAKYKRLGLIWHGEERHFIETLMKWGFITVWWGGKTHPDDDEEMRDWNRRFQSIRGLTGMCPVMNYDLELIAPLAKCAADIWLQSMMQGYEASGTSGMIAALNLALNISIYDGAYREMKNIIFYGTRHDADSDILLQSEEERWHPEYKKDAQDLSQILFDIIPRMRKNDPKLLDLIFQAKLEAEEKYSALVVSQRYIDELYAPI